MDNYSYEEVKMLINKNLVTPEVLNNILKSTTRRLELYKDKDDLKILQYLSNSELIPEDTKDEINKYLALYDSFDIQTKENTITSKKDRKGSLSFAFALIIVLLIVCIYLIIQKR